MSAAGNLTTDILTIAAIVAGGLAVIACAAAIVVAAIKKIPILDALKVVGLGALFGILAALAVVAAILAARSGKGKNNEDGTDGFPADSGSAGIGTAFDERRDQLKTRIEELLQQAGGR
ncbi:MAG: hypothetical protein JXD23_17145 [Spirochaetales bacterium]|nr:hypothetical protein [Spirochaetales bacterium]